MFQGYRPKSVKQSAVLAGLISIAMSLSPTNGQDFKDFDELMNQAGPRARNNADAPPSTSAPKRNLPESDRPDFDSNTTPIPRFNDDTGSAFETRRPPAGMDDRFAPLELPLNPSGLDGFSPGPLAPASPTDRSRFPQHEETDFDRSGVVKIGDPLDSELIEEFDWQAQTISVADLKFHSMDAFKHGEAFLSAAEETAYLELLETIRERRRTLVKRTSSVTRTASTANSTGLAKARVSGKGVAEWQEGFYEFPEARRLAFNNGHLRGQLADTAGGLPDPFAPAKKNVAPVTEDVEYDLFEDIRRYPDHFVGRPIVLYGRYIATSAVRLGGADPDESTFGELRYSAEAATPEVYRLMRGRLLGLTSSEELAVVDTRELLTPQMGLLTAQEWPGDEESIPVMVKGWVVKRWDNRPLIYCETMRQISPIPHFQLVRRSAFDRSRLREGEKWLYYETLKQMEMTSDAAQQEVARTILNQRIDELMVEVEDKAKADLKSLGDDFRSAKIDEAKFDRSKVILQRQLDLRIARYRRYRKHPEKFQTFVDVFQHSDFWHGHVVTLRGHVRHVVSYPGDQKLFDGRMLHELWLFTDDSQHNPAVIVTPNLPDDFPTEAEVIDGISVTGCFYKRYIYGSQDADRIAPLLLAGRIHWTPTADQVQTLVADGHMAADSARARKAASMNSGLGDAALMMLCFLVILTFMMFWGRAQREERDRLRLRNRINDVSEGYSPVLSGPGGIGDYIPDEYRVD